MELSPNPSPRPVHRPRVGLFVTCLVDLMRPSVGFAAVKLLEEAGCIVQVPEQTCCGQPAYNTGDRSTTRAIAERVITEFRGYDYVVAPSGSCAGMIRAHYPELFADDPNWLPRANELAARTHELTSFLVDVLGVTRVAARFDGTVTYHDSCSGLRELGIRSQPRRLLQSIEGLRLVELEESDVCCGFGGTFAVKYSDISGAIVEAKARNVVETSAPTLLAGDLGCLLNMAGKLSRDGAPIHVRHVAEILAGMTDEPPIGIAKERPRT
ncbi:(Fe-S)-binding protein [Microvirga antarctica]|uniref:(Fe-S)-binding protein n=1 Tax=Microvirga antarctica TaxID=2819233 RepID=UPI001B300D57|nr:(Fe-S)-binding protein [Microvirga antarctica]